MASRPTALARQARVSGVLTQSRTVTTKNKAYLDKQLKLPRVRTVPHTHMMYFFGPPAVNGDYNQNKLCYAPKDHVPNYIPHVPFKRGRMRALERAANSNSTSQPREADYRPFPLNPYVKTSFLLSNELKSALLYWRDAGHSVAQLSSQYGIRKERVQAALKLMDSEREWLAQEKVTPDMHRFANRMYQMMPITNGKLSEVSEANHRDNRRRSEPMDELLPHPRTARNQIVLVDETFDVNPDTAAKQLGLKPAEDVIKEALDAPEPRDFSFQTHGIKGKQQKEELAGALKEWKGEDVRVKFSKRYVWVATPAETGKVGFRYGASTDDRKKYRKHKDPRLNI